MIRLYLLLGIVTTSFLSGAFVSHRFFQVEALRQKVLYLQDQAKKLEKAEEKVKELTKQAEDVDKELDTIIDTLEKGVPKHDKSDRRIILPDSWMRQLDRVR